MCVVRVMVCLVLVGSFSSSYTAAKAWGQESEPAVAETAKEKRASRSTARVAKSTDVTKKIEQLVDGVAMPIRQRLPRYFGKLAMMEDQRAKVYAIQSKYDAQLRELTQQMEGLRMRRDSELSDLLSEAQREQLAEFQSARTRGVMKEVSESASGDLQ